MLILSSLVKKLLIPINFLCLKNNLQYQLFILEDVMLPWPVQSYLFAHYHCTNNSNRNNCELFVIKIIPFKVNVRKG